MPALTGHGRCSTSDKRAGLFDDTLDVSDFKPKPAARPEQIKAVAEQSGFRSCDPVPGALPDQPRGGMSVGVQEQRRHRTGRNQQLNLKVRAQDAEAFYALADAHGWVLGEVFARAVAALARELQPDK